MQLDYRLDRDTRPDQTVIRPEKVVGVIKMQSRSFGEVRPSVNLIHTHY